MSELYEDRAFFRNDESDFWDELKKFKARFALTPADEGEVREHWRKSKDGDGRPTGKLSFLVNAERDGRTFKAEL